MNDESTYRGSCWHCKNAKRGKLNGKIYETKCKLGEYVACQCAGTEDYFELDKRTLPRKRIDEEIRYWENQAMGC